MHWNRKPTTYEFRCHIGKEKEASNQYWEIKKKADQYRLSFLQKKAEDTVADSNLKASIVYEQLILREKQRRAISHVKYALKKQHGGGITKIDVIKHGQRISVTNKDDIEREYMEEHDNKYRQTQLMPCMWEPLHSLLGALAPPQLVTRFSPEPSLLPQIPVNTLRNFFMS